MTCEKRTALLHTATTMTGSGKSIRERITLIVNKPKMAAYTLVAVLLIAVVTVACTFTGAQERADPADELTDPVEDRENGTEESIDIENSGETIPNAVVEADPQKTEIDPTVAIARLETLTAGDITSTGAVEGDASELAALIRDAMANRIESAEAFSPFWSVEVTQLPYASDVYSVSGHFLDETHILLTSAFEVGAPHKILYSLAHYDITTGELTELPGEYTAKDKSASNFLAMCEGGAAAYTYENGYLVIIDLMTWEKTVTRFMERGVVDIFCCPGALVGVKYETVVYLLDHDGNVQGVCA